MIMNKRRFLLAASVSAAAVLTIAHLSRAAPPPAGDAGPAAEIQARWRDFLAAEANVTLDKTPLKRAHEQWRQTLPADSYAVLFEEDTEAPFSSHLNLEKRPGLFVCRACRLPLFSAEMKYESGTAGQVSSRISSATSPQRKTSKSSCREPSITACAAVGIKATSSTTAPTRPASAGAITAPHSTSCR